MDRPSENQLGGFLVASVGYATASGFSQAMAPFGLHPREFAVLRALGGGDGASQQDLSRALHVPGSRMVALIDALAQRGLLRRDPHPTDRRKHALRLTEDGHALLTQAQRAARDYDTALFATFTAAERAELDRLLLRLAGTLELPMGTHPEMSEPAEGGATDPEADGGSA